MPEATPRRFRDAPQHERCKWEIRLRDGSAAQCGRRAVVDGLCRQHAKIDAALAQAQEQP